MPYWVYGKDISTGGDREPLFCETDDASHARLLAEECGMSVDELEYVVTPSDECKTANESERQTADASRATLIGGLTNRELPRCVKWLVAGGALILVSFVVFHGINDYIMNGTIRQAFGRAHRYSWLGQLANLGFYVGVVLAAVGGGMYIVDTSPVRNFERNATETDRQ